MPKYFCDYCDVYLTHDSMSVRKAHNSGRNHLRNVVDYYQQIGHEKAQSVIDSITSSYADAGQQMPVPGGMMQPSFGGGMPGPPPGFPAGMPPFPPPGGFPGGPGGMVPPGGRGMPPFPFPPGPNGMPGFPPPGGMPFTPNSAGSPPQGMPFPPPGQGGMGFPPPGMPMHMGGPSPIPGAPGLGGPPPYQQSYDPRRDR